MSLRIFGIKEWLRESIDSYRIRKRYDSIAKSNAALQRGNASLNPI